MSSDGVLSFVATTDRSKFPPVSARRRPGLIERSVRKPWPENVDVRFLSRAVNKRDGTPDGFRNRGRFKLPLHYPVQPSRYLYAHVRYRSYTPNREISSFPNVIFGKAIRSAARFSTVRVHQQSPSARTVRKFAVGHST